MRQTETSGPERHATALPERALGGVGALLVVWLVVGTSAAVAVEPAEKFIEGLRQRGHDELVLDYLTRMEISPLADASFKRRIAYYRGTTLLDLARQAVDPQTRSRLLDEARAELVTFAANNPGDPSTADAQLQLAGMLVEQGRHELSRAAQLPDGAAFASERNSYQEQARTLLDDARKLYLQAAAIYEKNLDGDTAEADNGDASQNTTAGDQRQGFRGLLARALVLAAQAQYEAGQTWPSDSREFRRLHEEAAQQLAQLYEDYSRWLVGLYAHLYEGRCYQALGDYQRAMTCYDTLIAQPSIHPAFRKLIAAAYRYKAECHLALEMPDEAIASSSAWLEASRDDELRQPEWLGVRFRLAEALRQKGKQTSDGTLEQRRVLAEAREAFQFVAASPGEFQTAARQALVALPSRSAPRRDEPRDFMTAYEAGKEAITSSQAAKLAIPSAQRNAPSALADLQQQLDEGKQQAEHYFRLATGLVDDETDIELLNEVRYFLCWLYWENEDYYRTAVLGEFLARRYPNHPASSAAAKLAMASYDRLYRAALDSPTGRSDTEFEARRMARMAEFITRRWPETPDADAAFGVLVSYAIRNDRIDEAERLLAEVSSRQRPRLELQLGNAMWARYLELSQGGAEDPATLEQLRTAAIERLQNGFDAAHQSRIVNTTSATAALYLVQALLSDDRPEPAIRLLEDPQMGPLTLVAGGHPAASRPDYAMEVYKAALRAYLSVTPPRRQEALETIAAFDALVESSGAGMAEERARVYLGLGLTLQQQIDRLREAGNDAEADRVTAAYAQLLDRLSQHSDDAPWALQNWIAQTYYEMGQRLAASGGGSAPGEAYFVKARDAFRQLIAAAEANPDDASSPEALLVAKKQYGDCLRELGDYQEALEAFSAVLKERESWLAAQQAAALAYEMRGRAGDPQWLERAIYGGYRLRSTGENRIWGWLKLSQVADRAARSDPKYRDLFFEARYHAARCRYLAGMRSDGAARNQHLAVAMQTIRSMEQLFPDMGGDRWRGKFDRLVQQIQQAQQSG